MLRPSEQGEIKIWSDEEINQLVSLKSRGYTYTQIAEVLGRTKSSVKSKMKRARTGDDVEGGVIPESRFQLYNDPLVMEGDAIVLPDIELPFHNAEFMNRCLDLVDTWGIKKAIVAGDLLHFDSLSTWEANWIKENGYGISENIEKKLMDMAMRLPSKYQDEVIATIMSFDKETDEMGSGVSRELAEARKVVRIMTEIFDEVDFILGNHDDRFLRAIKSPMFPSEILRLVEAGDKWRVKPYYYSKLISGDETFQIEHPKTWAKSSPYKLAAKFQCHILQAHSHKWGIDLDISGSYWAIHMGCIVDEWRLPYAVQRHNTADAHALGAVIVRDGYPYLLSERTPWNDYKKMV